MKTQLLRPFILRIALAATGLFISANVYAQWTAVGSTGFDAFGNLGEHVFFDASNTAYVSYANPHGQVKKYTGTGWVPVGGTDITTTTASDSWSAIGPDGKIYFSYADGTDSSQAAVLMYDGSSWSSIGSSLSIGAATNTNIVISPAGIPYISFIDHATSPSRLYVKKYNGASWVLVGGMAIDTTDITYPSLAIDNNDSVYIAYCDEHNTQKIIAKKFNSMVWIMLDTAFSAVPVGDNAYISLAIDHNNIPYISYLSDSTHNSVSVSKYNGTHFTTLGSVGFSPEGSDFSSLAIDHSNVPYVVFGDNSIEGKSSVMKYTDTGWAYVGASGFSPASAIFTTIAIDGNNNLYTSFLDGSDGGTTVMEYTVCTPSSAAVATSSDTSICRGTIVSLAATGDLHDAANWYWYTGSCTGTLVDTGATINVTPGDTTTYYVHGYGGCVLSSTCTSVTINVDTVGTPVISLAGHVLTSSAVSGNQWYKDDVAIPGATGQTDSAVTTGWYTVMVTNSNGCSATSDSVFIDVTEGVATIGSNSGISVYPSPTTDIVNVDFINTKHLTAANLYITDNVGQVVFIQSNLQQKNKISVKDLSPGSYFIVLKTPDGKQTMQIVKQ